MIERPRPPPPSVISLEPRIKRQTRPLLDVVRTQPCMCSFRVDEKTRTVTCIRCGRAWDPFDALLYMARDFSRFHHNRDTLKREAEQSETELRRLKKEVQNVRRKLRAAQQRARPALLATGPGEPAPKLVR